MKFEYRLTLKDIPEANIFHHKKVFSKYYLVLIIILFLSALLPLVTRNDIPLSEILLSIVLHDLCVAVFI